VLHDTTQVAGITSTKMLRLDMLTA
jgi:hypothetical protein